MQPNWADLVDVYLPAGSANPVLRLTFRDRKIYWLKVTAGGKRIAFAGKVMERVGFDRMDAHVLDVAEFKKFTQRYREIQPKRQWIVAAANAGKSKPAIQDTIDKMSELLGRGNMDLVVTEHVGGNGTYHSWVGRDGKLSSDVGKKHIQIMQNAQTQRDLARIIAVDMLLGNYDRALVTNERGAGKVRGTQFNTNNFVYCAAKKRFLPIDNDTVAPPKIENLDAKSPTKLDLYRVAVLGGWLSSEFVASGEAPDVSAMLGPSAEDEIFNVIAWQGGIDDGSVAREDLPQLRSIAAQMVPQVELTL